MPDQKVERVSFTRRFLDRAKNPPEYVDEELPTKTVKIFSRKKQGTICYGTTSPINMGSIRFSGSHYDFSPGSSSLRIIRRSVHIGSVELDKNIELDWVLRHSREGTVDSIPFFLGTQLAANRRGLNRGDAEAFGGPMNPLYVFGPGTLWSYFKSYRGTARVYSSLEGIF